MPRAISCINVAEAPHGSPLVASRTWRSQLHRRLFRAVLQPYLSLHLSEVHDRYSSSASTSGQVKANRTILNFPHTGLDIVKRQVADLVPDAVEVHVSDLLVGLD